MHSPNTLCILQQHLKEYGRQAVRNRRCYLTENLDICKMAKKFFCFLSRRSKIPLLYMYALKILVLFNCFCSSSWDWIWTKVNGPYFPILKRTFFTCFEHTCCMLAYYAWIHTNTFSWLYSKKLNTYRLSVHNSRKTNVELETVVSFTIPFWAWVEAKINPQ